MPSLRRLEVHCPFESPLPDAAFLRAAPPAGLRWLRAGLYPLRTALALARAHAATLRELELVAASEQPYGCPALEEQLQRCGLARLQRLLLIRGAGRTAFCQHEPEECSRQKVKLWEMFMGSGVIVTVACSECDAADPKG
ncbi:hypothetical protein ONE63_001106 [Megalurothrips usitatus]|uniref:Uncharacterized protein n=1 Tax=Megalurothrips usitatus TaxID=439358 RepID=A0AAV7XHD9_9NEOP|nr:hypothetical protein ONE63_001106 [Megalurothrips usitatus]